MSDDRDLPLTSAEMLRRAREQERAPSSPATEGYPIESGDTGADRDRPSSSAEMLGQARESDNEASVPESDPGIRWPDSPEDLHRPDTAGHPIEPVGSGGGPRKRFDWVHFLFRFDGRINRAKFWLGVVTQYVFFALLFLIFDGTNSQVGQALFGLGFIPLIWVSAAVAIKRWHDRDKSGWWVLIAFVPFIGVFWAIIEPGFLPGDDGKNRYGPDPLAAQQLPDDSPVPPVRPRRRKVGVGIAIAFGVVGLGVLGAVVGDDDEAVTTYNEGVEMFEDGRWEDAIVAFTEVIESDPSDTDLLARAYVNRSAALNELGRSEEALADATAAIELEPADTDTLAQAYLNRGASLILLGRSEESLADATAVIELEPDDDYLSRGHLLRGVVLSDLGRTDEAVPDLQIVIALRPPGDEMRELAVEFLSLLGFSE